MRLYEIYDYIKTSIDVYVAEKKLDILEKGFQNDFDRFKDTLEDIIDPNNIDHFSDLCQKIGVEMGESLNQISEYVGNYWDSLF